MRILAVDDDPIILDLLERCLPAAQNYTVHRHDTAESTMELIKSARIPYECILLDINLPGKDGIELCQMLRRMKCYQSTPILMITGSQELGVMQRAFDAGATDFIRKPLNSVELRARILSAGLLNDSMTSALHSQAELSRLTQIKFDEMLNLDVAGVLDFMALENKMLRFPAGCYAMSLFSLKVTDVYGIYRTVKPLLYRECLKICAAAAAAVLKDLSAHMAYGGNGQFVGVITGRGRVNFQALNDEFDAQVAKLWDSEATGVPVAPKGQFQVVSQQRLWSGMSAGNKLRDFAKASPDPARQLAPWETNLFA